MSRDRRWPSFVYGAGQEPDYRFSFANERTYLAWIRTSLALLAAGVAVDVVDLSISSGAQHALAVLLVALGVICAVAAWVRWALAERAMRRREPLPSFGLAVLVTILLVAAAMVLVLAL